VTINNENWIGQSIMALNIQKILEKICATKKIDLLADFFRERHPKSLASNLLLLL
jgi:hypothetical protein